MQTALMLIVGGLVVAGVVLAWSMVRINKALPPPPIDALKKPGVQESEL